MYILHTTIPRQLLIDMSFGAVISAFPRVEMDIDRLFFFSFFFCQYQNAICGSHLHVLHKSQNSFFFFVSSVMQSPLATKLS